MAVSELTFYQPIPILGVSFKDQLGSMRSNSNALAPLVRGAFADMASIQAGAHVLTGLAIGEQGFKNRFRMFYDKTNNEYQVQVNQGTVTEQTWVTYLKIRESDGRVTATGPGGFESTGGFYNTDFLSISETRTGGTTHESVSLLNVNSEFFYITRAGQNATTLNFIPNHLSKDLTINSPTPPVGLGEHTWFFTPRPITIQRVSGLLQGSSTPHVGLNLNHNTNRDSVGNNILNTSFYLTSTTIVELLPTDTGDTTIPENSFIWVETTGTAGTVDELNLSLEYTEDR